MQSGVSDLLTLQVRQIRWEAEGISSYEFVSEDGSRLPAFTAGAHIDLHLPEQRVRSYSLVNDPDEGHRYVIAVQHEAEGRGGSAWMHAVARVGDRLQATPPSNDFPLDDSASPVVLIAGGVGITPILAMLRRLNRVQRPWQLHYAARSPQLAAFAEEVQGLAGAHGTVALHLGGAGGERLSLQRILDEAPPDVQLYCCGPARMIDEFAVLCAGRPAARVHVERFAAASSAATGGGFELVLQRSVRRLAVASGKTILDTLLDHGVDVQYACTAGVCGTCRTRVMAGLPDHRDDYLSDEEKARNDSIMVCCSGSRSATLVLDL